MAANCHSCSNFENRFIIDFFDMSCNGHMELEARGASGGGRWPSAAGVPARAHIIMPPLHTFCCNSLFCPPFGLYVYAICFLEQLRLKINKSFGNLTKELMQVL